MRTFGALLLLPYLVIAVLVVTGAATWSSLAYVAAMGAVVAGLLRREKRTCQAGSAAIAIVALVRVASAGKGTTMEMYGGSHVLSRLVEEADIAVAATNVLVGAGLLRDDARELPSAMRKGYAEMRAEEGDMPTPQLRTYLGLEIPDAFDLMLYDRGGDAAVLFLHGSAGSFTLPCFQMAKAVNVTTACPAMRWTGDWWTPQGDAIVRRTVAILRARGAGTIVLAGLSNGGYGASRLAPRMKGTFAGLVLISGAAWDAGPAGVPTLVIHGERDTMASAQEGQAYAARNHAELVSLDAGHFAMLVRRDKSDAAVRAFVARRVAAVTTGELR